MFNRIIAASDIVTTGDAPVVSAARLARQQKARLYLLHVMESTSTENRRLIRHFDTGAEMMADAQYINAVRRRLENTYEKVLADVPHEIRIAAGFPWEEILRWATEIETDLIVLGPHSTRAQEKGVVRVAGRVGSTVENVVTRETCPVMVVRQPAEVDQLSFQRVLVAVEFSRSCECAIRFAARLARNFHSRLSVFHMLPVPPVPKYTRSDYTADATGARKRLESFYEGYLKDSDHDYLLRAGAVPALEIQNAAIDRHADLIVMGSHTKDASGKWYPGSAVERVSHKADCPVIVITDPGVLMHWNGVAAGDDGQNKDRLIHLFTKTPTYHLNKLREILVVGVSKALPGNRLLGSALLRPTCGLEETMDPV